ncbi:oligosaccharide flippase family protein [Methylobacterium sp. 77]|uniref:lipopolysaccharide biosynthesis protein n=1 Tax=Methylobacterium sp. 77 TaxID=1101192 RepID=UPI000366C517|nr:oligosaccharide flippase family protein [Methylobacterium sp. 77]
MSAELDILDIPRSAALRGIRRRIGLDWLGHPSAYAIGVCLVSLLSMGTTLIIPRLLDPAAFGSFALLGTLFQYAARSDLGLSQLADRDLASRPHAAAARSAEILQASWALGLIGVVVLTPVAVAAALASGRFAPLDAALAVIGGVLGMVAHAPTMIYRAASQHWDFTLLALVQQAGLTAPRLAGLVLGGVTGCFAALALWSVLLLALFGQPQRAFAWKIGPLAGMVRQALPLFVFNGLWLAYMTSNRWVSAFLSAPEQLGLFAFGANLAMVGLAIVGAVAQVRYPKLLSGVASTPEATSAMFEHEARRVGLVLAGIALLAIFLTGPVIALLFPGYEAATSATIGLALSCVPLGVVAWTIPMAMVLTDKPLVEALRLFVPALVVLVALIVVGDSYAGIAGQGWGCALAGLLTFVGLVAMLRRARIVAAVEARRMAATQIVLASVIALTAAVWRQQTAPSAERTHSATFTAQTSSDR